MSSIDCRYLSGYELRIADLDKAARTVQRLIAPEMFSGWASAPCPSARCATTRPAITWGPSGPTINSLIAAGFRRYGYSRYGYSRYGYDDAALRVFQGTVEAAMHFTDHRLPELFMGFPRGDYGVPVSYPVACRPQAWAAGAVPYLVRTLLGLTAEAFDRRLRIVRPVLPDFVHALEVHRLRVGDDRVDLRFERTGSGKVAVDVLAVEGHLEVVMDLRGIPPRSVS
jgi:hypothetical protein